MYRTHVFFVTAVLNFFSWSRRSLARAEHAHLDLPHPTRSSRIVDIADKVPSNLCDVASSFRKRSVMHPLLQPPPDIHPHLPQNKRYLRWKFEPRGIATWRMFDLRGAFFFEPIRRYSVAFEPISLVMLDHISPKKMHSEVFFSLRKFLRKWCTEFLRKSFSENDVNFLRKEYFSIAGHEADRLR